MEVGRESVPADFELVDLRDWPLPADEEPGVPAAHPYTSERTRAWSAKISEASGFVFVTPQYNWGYPAPLKNALDRLYKEWVGKPAVIVTYGGHRGDKCARQLRQVVRALHMRPVATMPGFRISRARIEANSGEIDPAKDLAKDVARLRRAFAGLAAMLGGKPVSLWSWRLAR